MIFDSSRRRSRPSRLAVLTPLLLGTAACGSTPPVTPSTDPTSASAPATAAPSASTAAPEQPTTSEESTVTSIRITIDDQTTITAELADNPTAQDLAAQLPLTLTFRDFNRVEKVAELPRPLTIDGVPAGDDPEINDIGYYAPSNGLVFYYGDVGYWNGIVRIGRLQPDDTDTIRRQPDGFQVTIDRA